MDVAERMNFGDLPLVTCGQSNSNGQWASAHHKTEILRVTFRQRNVGEFESWNVSVTLSGRLIVVSPVSGVLKLVQVNLPPALFRFSRIWVGILLDVVENCPPRMVSVRIQQVDLTFNG